MGSEVGKETVYVMFLIVPGSILSTFNVNNLFDEL